MMDQIYIGVDVAKVWLDIYHPARGAKRIENTPSSVRSFARVAAREGVWVIFEASGGYDRVLRDGLEAVQASFSRVNPRQCGFQKYGTCARSWRRLSVTYMRDEFQVLVARGHSVIDARDFIARSTLED